MADDREPKEILEDISRLIGEYAQSVQNKEDGVQVVVTASVFMFEQMTFAGDDNVYAIKYAFPERLSMSSALGVTHLGCGAIEDALMGDDKDDD
jgi:hypothetical protein